MKKIILFAFASMLLMTSRAQVNQRMIDPDLDREILIGQIDLFGLKNPMFVKDWQTAQEEYSPDKMTVKELKKRFRKNKNLYLVVYFGSWCGDSREHLPHFVKLAQKTKLKKVSYYALNRKKTLPKQDLTAFQIEYVPTFIVYINDKEIGRIVETPEISLEKDLLKILDDNL